MYLDDCDDLIYEISEENYKKQINLNSEFPVRKIPEELILSDIGSCFIQTNYKAGMTPHFEIHSIDDSFKTCLEIYNPNYYFRDSTEFSKLNSIQIDELIEFLQKYNKLGIKIYNTIQLNWKYLNSGKLIKYTGNNIPDYNKLKEIN